MVRPAHIRLPSPRASCARPVILLWRGVRSPRGGEPGHVCHSYLELVAVGEAWRSTAVRTPQEQVCWARTRGPSLHLRAQPQPRAAMLLANREKLCRSLERRATRMAPRRAASQTRRSPRAAQSGSREPRRAARTWEASQHSASCPRSSRPGLAWRGATAVCVALRRPPSPEQPHSPWRAPGEEPAPFL